MERTFTVDEAQRLLPVLKTLLSKAIEARSKLQELEAELGKLKSRIFLSGGLLPDVRYLQARKADRDQYLQLQNKSLAEIDSIGVQVKDLDIGLLDFPCMVDGELILLCWKMGEEQIGFWHGPEEGFRGRKPIDERIRGRGDKFM